MKNTKYTNSSYPIISRLVYFGAESSGNKPEAPKATEKPKEKSDTERATDRSKVYAKAEEVLTVIKDKDQTKYSNKVIELKIKQLESSMSSVKSAEKLNKNNENEYSVIDAVNTLQNRLDWITKPLAKPKTPAQIKLSENLTAEAAKMTASLDPSKPATVAAIDKSESTPKTPAQIKLSKDLTAEAAKMTASLETGKPATVAAIDKSESTANALATQADKLKADADASLAKKPAYVPKSTLVTSTTTDTPTPKV